MSSEAKYHATCYKSFVRISYDIKNDEINSTDVTGSRCRELQLVCSEVFNFCEDLIANPRVVEFLVIKEVFINKESEHGANISESDKKNLTR